MVTDTIITMVEDSVRNEIIYPYIDKIFDGIIIETGVFLGGNLCRMSYYAKTQNKQIVFYGIDNFSFTHSESGDGCGGTLCQSSIVSYEQCYQNIISCGLSTNTRLIFSNSILASRLFNDNTIDLIFLDTVHTYEYLTYELVLWYDKVKKGGIISGHDYQMLEVQRAINDIYLTKQVNITSDGSSYWVCKE